LGNKKSIWEDPSREVAQIFDGTTVKARPRKRNTDVEGIGRARTSVRVPPTRPPEVSNRRKRISGGETLGYQGQVTVSPSYLDWEFVNGSRV